MKTSIKTELSNHIIDFINDNVLTDENQQDWHFHAFNEDHYLIGYYQCSEWLKEHNIDAFEAIEICQTYDEENFGEIMNKYDNSEKTVNMLAYIYGEELFQELQADTIEELEESISNI